MAHASVPRGYSLPTNFAAAAEMRDPSPRLGEGPRDDVEMPLLVSIVGGGICTYDLLLLPRLNLIRSCYYNIDKLNLKSPIATLYTL